MRVAGVILAIGLALALQATLARFMTSGSAPVDFVLVVVVYVALASGPVTGLLTGTVGGLIQDALATGVVGIGGLAKSIVGFVAGVAGTQFIVAQPIPRFVVFSGATVLHAALFISACALATEWLYGSALIGQTAFYLAALAGYAQRRRRSFIFTVPCAMCVLIWATVVGFIRFVMQRQQVTWERTVWTNAAGEGPSPRAAA